MKSPLPKGLMVLSLITIAGCLSVLNSVLRPDGHIIYAGQVLQGVPFKVYYSLLGAVDLCIGIGLLLRRRWSYFCFLVFSAYSALMATTNIILTDNETLIRAGWKLTPINSWSFQFFQVGVVCVVVLMVLWLRRYRGEFKQDSANNGIQRSVDTAGSR